jgi:hypothetical protein
MCRNEVASGTMDECHDSSLVESFFFLGRLEGRNRLENPSMSESFAR